MNYFTADLHFQHKNIITYCHRPFKTVEEMDEVMINCWNAIVKSNDTVYIVGDFGFGKLDTILRRLLGHKILILGSHDKSALQCQSYFDKVSPLMEITIEGQPIVLCHYAMRVWPRSHYGSWHLYGHSHGKLPMFFVKQKEYYEPVIADGKSFDVGVDGHDFKPWSFDEVKKKMLTLPDNFNLVRKDGKTN